MLALQGEANAGPALKKARAWLDRNQRGDGGYAPSPEVRESTWATALPLLAGAVGAAAENRAIAWLLRQTGQETTWAHRLRLWLLGVHPEYDKSPGWPWYPATAAWVVPTAITLLALRRVEARDPQAGLQSRIEQGRRFLLGRRCEDGGWNHGSTRALGFQAVSYPETTGLALLALAGSAENGLERSLAKAEQHYRDCRSREGQAWLELGFLAHNRPVPQQPPVPPRTLLDLTLGILAARARQGRNVFLERAA